MRYNTIRPDTGETRAEYNARFDHPTPQVIVPEEHYYIWEWFFDISSCVDRAGDGFCKPITAHDYLAWQNLTGNIVRSEEYDILRAMDIAYVRAMSDEIKDHRARSKTADQTK